MQIISPSNFTTMPWKNGGGITREIARVEDNGRLLWRLSIADVASDGPFSTFPGLTRVLTVIEGKGMALHTPDGVLTAKPLMPVRFFGEVPVIGRLVAGPVRDFNLIFDAERIAGDVGAFEGPFVTAATSALLALGTGVSAEDVAIPPGAAVLDAKRVAVGPGANALLVTLTPA